MDTLSDIARATAAEHGMFPPGAPVVAMVSGGADSMALLHLLTAWGFGEDRAVSVLHVNHLLRGQAADEDEAFVVSECARLGVACHVERVDVAGFADAAGLNLEDAGRTVRYRLAAEMAYALAEAAGVPPESARIAVAHTLDDRIETFLMRLLSGSGARGLASIRPVRERVVRPLLDAPRSQVRSWLEEHGVRWREDASNLDTERTRARIRHELLPALADAEPAFRTTLARTMRILAEEDELLGEMAEAFAHDFSAQESREGEVSLDRAMFATLSMPMRRRVLISALEQAFPEAERIDSEHIEAVAQGVSEDAFARDLPDGLRAFCEYGRITVLRRGEGPRPVAPSLLRIPGSVDLGSAGTIIAETQGSFDDIHGDASSVVVDVGDARMVSIGPVRPGERMQPLGMEGTKKLSDLLIDAKVPRRDRQSVPVVRDGERVVWLAGVRQSEESRVGPGTVRAVRLTWEMDR